MDVVNCLRITATLTYYQGYLSTGLILVTNLVTYNYSLTPAVRVLLSTMVWILSLSVLAVLHNLYSCAP